MSMKMELFIGGIFMLGMFIAVFQAVQLHEKVHQIIYSDYGVDSEITVKWFGLVGGETYAADPSKCGAECNKEHRLNEIVGYNVAPVFIMSLLIAGLLLLIVIQGMKKE